MRIDFRGTLKIPVDPQIGVNRMKLKQLLNDDYAVSPVIGVILMVAITVILAAVIATFVLGLGEQVSDSAPNASFSFDYDSNGPDVTVTHSGGPNIDESQLSIVSDGTPGGWPDSEVSAGDSNTVSGVTPGETISVVWENEEGTESSTLQRYNVPS